MSKTATATIRRSLKAEHGLTSRQVSVRSQHGSIECTVKDPAVKLATVEQVARKHERIDRDEVTGCILRGGNTFVKVQYAESVLAPLAARVLPQLKELERTPGKVGDVEGLAVWYLDDDHYGGSFRAAPKDCESWDGPAYCGAQHASEQIAILLLNA
jgi:hypothetical protein